MTDGSPARRFPTVPASTWLRTLAGLRLDQAVQRARLRARRKAYQRLPPTLLDPRLRRPRPITSLPLVSREAKLHTAAEAEQISKGQITLLHQQLRYPEGIHWFDPSVLQLRRYHLHYFDWAWAFAKHPNTEWAAETLEIIWHSWDTEVSYGQWIPWHPYVVACRLWNLLQVNAALFPGPSPLTHSLWEHACYLRNNLEMDVQGNHLIRNLRALFAAGIAFTEPAWQDKAIRLLKKQLGKQLLGDGGHFERSAYYHAQVLTDLEEIRDLAVGVGCVELAWLHIAIAKMRRFLSAVSPAPGVLPVFHDGSRQYPRAELPLPSDDELECLVPSGYVVFRRYPWYVAMDVGRPAPPELPAHGHCSTLSLEVFHRGLALVVNSGTSSYDEPEIRHLERSTAFHNTLEIDHTEQSEIWHFFRMGRQATVQGLRTSSSKASLIASASHDGYARLTGSPVHERIVTVTDSTIEVADRVWGAGIHHLKGTWNIPSSRAVVSRGQVWRVGEVLVSVSSTSGALLIRQEADAWMGEEFGLRHPTQRLTWSLSTHLPTAVITRFTVDKWQL